MGQRMGEKWPYLLQACGPGDAYASLWVRAQWSGQHRGPRTSTETHCVQAEMLVLSFGVHGAAGNLQTGLRSQEAGSGILPRSHGVPAASADPWLCLSHLSS